MFEWDGADLLAYAALITARRDADPDLLALCGVYEWQQEPIAFLIDGQLVKDDEHLKRIRRRLAMRGDAPYMCVIRGGQLIAYKVGLDSASMKSSEIHPPLRTKKFAYLPYLSNVRPELKARRRWIEQVVLSLLDEAITGLITSCSVASVDAISMVGRALFVRFLADRAMLSDDVSREIASVSVEELFDTSESAHKICQWLDFTFNGDLLPLDLEVFDQLPSRGFAILGDILRRAPRGQRMLPWAESWAHLDFAYIPVGVLSQAYEHYLRVHAPVVQQREGGFYTPVLIAQMMVRGAMHAIQSETDSHKVRVLDPAAGAGVFLIAAFRQLVAERWIRDGKRPTTPVLRKILYDQITGFDVNEEALRFAALGLYLISIELDPNPLPIKKLRFERNLRDRVLFKVGEPGSSGSLGDAVGKRHEGRYSIVIGNAPWSSGTSMHEWDQVRRHVNKVAEPRLLGTPYRAVLPNEVLDLPFVWRAMEWCRPGGQIALALHARMLFQQGDGMPEARNAIFNAVDITGIVNGADLRNSRVWPEVGAPFCLLFARNASPTPASSFRFVSPKREDRLHATGAFRLDATSAPMLTPGQVVEHPEILKILYRGGPLDMELLGRMKIRQTTSVGAYWNQFADNDANTVWSGSGYQRLRASSRVRKNGDGFPGVSAKYLHGLPSLVAMRELPVLLAKESTVPFEESRIHDPRSRDLFRAPLLLVHQSPPAYSGRLNVSVSDFDVVFTESFYGYSAYKHPEGSMLVRFLALILGSKPTLWHSLLVSGKFGFEREVVEKSAIDTIHIPMFEALNREQREAVERLFAAVSLSSDNVEAWRDVDEWVAGLYGFKKNDLEVIGDTLKFNAPFSSSKEAAQSRPGPSQVTQFISTLEGNLDPLARRYGRKLYASQIILPVELPWFMFKLTPSQDRSKVADSDITPILDLADRLGTTEVISSMEDGSVLIARLDQARYWTSSQARLLARRLVWDNLHQLIGATA